MEVQLEKLSSIDEFDVFKYTRFPFFVSKKRPRVIYYRCKYKAELKCCCTCRVKFNEDLTLAVIKIDGVHNHPIKEETRITKEAKKKIEEIIVDKGELKPSKILNQYTSTLTNNELHDISNVPTKKQISYIKSKYIHSSFPTPDHTWNCVISHGPFEGSTKFLKFFSLIPLVLVVFTEEGKLRLNGNSPVHFFDSTHSVCNLSLSLLCIMTIEAQSRMLLFIVFQINIH